MSGEHTQEEHSVIASPKKQGELYQSHFFHQAEVVSENP